ncbi:MAG: M14 family zinc carboxypeptidase [candidate division WOR-3 bacterium]|nr:M14 family zinc carboxypeptidase [candidate division WOR-3 bacterium]
MKKHLTVLFAASIIFGLALSPAMGKEMIVRVYVNNYQELNSNIPFKGTNIEIAGAELGAWYDLVVTSEDYPLILGSGLKSEIIIEDLAIEKERALADGQYHSYEEINQILSNMASTYPSICKLDSFGTTFEGRQIYGVKISDNPEIDDPNEPDILFIGCHHAREWASVEVPRHIADSLTRGYATVPEIQNLIDNHEIWIFPIINVDGYVYDYPARRSWRKNRQPFSTAIGNDPNRNYNGCCNGDAMGDWGALTDGSRSTHYPSQETFMGPYGFSGYEINDLIDFFKAHEFNAVISYHSYSELVLWPWGYSTNTAPDNALLIRVGQAMAGLMQKLSSGNYRPQQGVVLYPTSGGSDDWMYGYSHWVLGVPCLSYTIELGTTFYQSVSDLDNIQFQAFKSALYLANFSDSVRILTKGAVPAPIMATLDTSATGDFTISWSPIRPHANQPELWEIEELSDYSVIEDNLEDTTARWTLEGFSLSTVQSHSSSHSFFSGSAHNMSNYARTAYPYVVQPADSLTFWCWYDLENNYDVATVEISFDSKEWIQLDDRYTGNSGGWIRKAYSLENWLGKSIYIRFRCMTDDGVLRTGFYVDDIYPVPYFNQTQIISSAITDTFYNITGQPVGQYWYRVKGYNSAWNWGDYSTLEDIIVTGTAIAEDCCPNESESKTMTAFELKPNPFYTQTAISFNAPAQEKLSLQIYDVMGKLVKSLPIIPRPLSLVTTVSWDGRDNKGMFVPAGVYWFKLTNNKSSIIKRGILLR